MDAVFSCSSGKLNKLKTDFSPFAKQMLDSFHVRQRYFLILLAVAIHNRAAFKVSDDYQHGDICHEGKALVGFWSCPGISAGMCDD
jgi:hypothetical protein